MGQSIIVNIVRNRMIPENISLFRASKERTERLLRGMIQKKDAGEGFETYTVPSYTWAIFSEIRRAER